MNIKTKIFFALVILFVASRLLGFNQMYHQDEYKWAWLSAEGQFNPIHPPMASALFLLVGKLFGFEHLRIVPIFFSLLLFLSTFGLARKLYGSAAAFFTALVLLVSSYNLLASIQIDIDGALLPFFAVLLFWSFFELDFEDLPQQKNYFWGIIFLLALAGGLATKLSFIIAIATLVSETYLRYRPSWRVVLRLALGLLVAGGAAAALVWTIIGGGILKLSDIVNYVSRFDDFNILTRNYSQVLFLSIKALILTSPLLVGGYLLALFKVGSWRRFRLWWIFLIYNLLFYFVVFDFSHGGTIERYVMFLIIPSAIITGTLLADYLKFIPVRRWLVLLGLTTAGCLGLWALVSQLSFQVLPLQPKSAYLEHLASLNFQFLIPITGGSGPSGFYVSALFVLLFFVLCCGAIIFAKLSRRETFKQWALALFVSGAIIYNVVLNAELISGLQYGNVTKVTRSAIAAVVEDATIPEVITYYDLGGYELRTAGKYRNRFYTDPMFTSNATKFAAWEGHFVVVDFPEINKDSVYWRYFLTCETVQQWQDTLVKAYIFDCQTGDRSLFK